MTEPVPTASRAHRWLLPAAVIVVFAAIGAWQANSVLVDRGAFDHDEVITHLGVTGHLDEWEWIQAGVPPTGTWVPAEDYRALMELDDDSSPAAVRTNLTDHDLHPPLYFWGVYGARDVGGVGLFRSGPAVNVVAGALTVVVLYLVLVPLFERRWLAALTAGLFTLSPAVAFASSLARPYVLLALWISTLLWVTARLLRSPRAWPLLATLALVTALGLLTAYPFAFALAGAVLLLFLKGVRRRSLADVAGAIGAPAVGVVLFAAVHPGFRDQLDRADLVAAGYESGQLVERLSDVLEGFFDILTLERWTDSAPGIAGAALLMALVTAPWWGRRLLPAFRRSPEVLAAVAVGATSAALTVLAYAAGRTPLHAYGRHYVVMFVPPLVVVVGALLARLRRPEVGLGVLAVGLLALSWHWQGDYQRTWTHQRNAVAAVGRGDNLVADCALRGYLPGVTMWARPDTEVLLLPLTPDAPPPPPNAVEPETTLFLHADPATCWAHSGTPGEVALDELGVAPDGQVGFIGKVQVLRVQDNDQPPSPDDG